MTDSSADPTARFSNRAADYAEARPRYPDSLVQLLATELALDPTSLIADIGAGTGLSAEPFLRAGFSVVCIEPNAAMRAAARQMLASYPGFRSAAGSAEATGLVDDSVDLVLVAQAFHWVDVSRAQREFMRILRSPGRVCIAWNTRRRTGSGFLAGYEAVLRRFGTDYEQVDARTSRLTGIDGEGGEELHRFFPRGHAHRVLENRQQLTFDGLVRRIRSSSYMPDATSPAYAAMLAALDALFAAESRDRRASLRPPCVFRHAAAALNRARARLAHATAARGSIQAAARAAALAALARRAAVVGRAPGPVLPYSAGGGAATSWAPASSSWCPPGRPPSAAYRNHNV